MKLSWEGDRVWAVIPDGSRVTTRCVMDLTHPWVPEAPSTLCPLLPKGTELFLNHQGNSSSERAKLTPSCEHIQKTFVDKDDAGIVALIKSAEKQHLAAGRGGKLFFQEHTSSCFDVAFKPKQGHVLNSQ